jgi:hypothetical protein
MKPTPIKSFADLAGVLREISAAMPPVANPPMSAAEVREAAETFAARHQREAARVVRLVSRPKNAPLNP